MEVKREIIVEVNEKRTSIALLENNQLQEFNVEDNAEEKCSVGDVFLGTVKKISPALNAAFVDLGFGKEGFLAYSDIGELFLTQQSYVKKLLTENKRLPSISKHPKEPYKEKDGQIEHYLKTGDTILVQVFKEPINTKGPRLTTDISISGRNVVLIPFAEKVLVSAKIKKNSEKQRLRELLTAIKPDGFGGIVRTLAEGKKSAELDKEVNLLKKKWLDLLHKIQVFPQHADNQKNTPFQRTLYKEVGRTIGFIRDVFNTDFNNIYINDAELRDDVKDYIDMVAPESVKKIKLYKKDQPIFDYFGVTKQLKVGMGRTVSLKNGGYLVIDKTEALVAIDVNSGSKKIFEDQEQNAFEYNKLATTEIAHILRLRDLGGIIVIDYIDMEDKQNQQAIYEQMCDLLSLDRAKHNILPLSKFCLMQITRQRIRPAITIDVSETCPTCHGKGKIQSSLIFPENVEKAIIATKEFVQNNKNLNNEKIIMHVHPYFYSYIDRGFPFCNLRHQWQRKYNIKIIENQQLGIMEYHFYDPKGHKISIPK